MPTAVAERPSTARQIAHRLGNQVASLVDADRAGPPAVNVGQTERWLTLLGGGALAVYGLTRDSLPGYVLAALGGSLVYRGLTGHCTGYAALGIDTADRHRNPRAAMRSGAGYKFEYRIAINRPAAELFRFWCDFANLPRVMRHLESVTVNGKRSHWVAKGPLGISVEWDAEIITERPNELIGWKSLDGSEVATAGSVHFRELPGNRGTEVHIVLKYDPPAGKVGALLARLFGRAPEQEIAHDLRNFKRLMERSGMAARAASPGHSY